MRREYLGLALLLIISNFSFRKYWIGNQLALRTNRCDVDGFIQVMPGEPNVFYCEGTGDMWATYAIATDPKKQLHNGRPDEIITALTNGLTCIIPPKNPVMEEGCYVATQPSFQCLGSIEVHSIPYGEGPMCMIIWCQSQRDRCKVKLKIEMSADIEVTQSSQTLRIGTTKFEVRGVGFGKDKRKIRIALQDKSRRRLQATIFKLKSTMSMIIELDRFFSRTNEGPVFLFVALEGHEWKEPVQVGIVKDPWPKGIEKIVVIIVLTATLFLLTCCAFLIWLDNRRKRQFDENDEVYERVLQLQEAEAGQVMQGYISDEMNALGEEMLNAVMSSSEEREQALHELELFKEEERAEEKGLVEMAI